MERIGRYVLLERIATGGMGEVFRAALRGPGGFYKQVAIKRIHPHLAADAGSAQMLAREARLAAELEHPNILRVLELGEQDGALYLVMEFVAGQTLAQVMDRAVLDGAPLPLGMVLNCAAQALRGLAHAHGHTDARGQPRDIIHRDISPQNLMLSYQGVVQLLDFGIARAADHVPQTAQGCLRGKPAYFAPELVRGAPVTQAADTYALGVVLHELFTLRPLRAVPADSPAWWQTFLVEPPPLRELRPDLPATVTALVDRSVSTDPERRFPSAAALGRAVEDVARQCACVWTPADLQAFLEPRFAREMERETRHRLRCQAEALDLPEFPPPTAAVPTSVAPVRPVRRPRALRWKALLLLAAGTTVLGGAATTAVATRANRAVAVEPAATPVPAEPAPPPPERPADPGAAGEPAPAEPRPRHGARKGWLSLQSRPWARVYLDGVDTGRFTPILRLRVTEGRHRVGLVNASLGLRATLKVDVHADRETVLSAPLR